MNFIILKQILKIEIAIYRQHCFENERINTGEESEVKKQGL